MGVFKQIFTDLMYGTYTVDYLMKIYGHKVRDFKRQIFTVRWRINYVP